MGECAVEERGLGVDGRGDEAGCGGADTGGPGEEAEGGHGGGGEVLVGTGRGLRRHGGAGRFRGCRVSVGVVGLPKRVGGRRKYGRGRKKAVDGPR